MTREHDYQVSGFRGPDFFDYRSSDYGGLIFLSTIDYEKGYRLSTIDDQPKIFYRLSKNFSKILTTIDYEPVFSIPLGATPTRLKREIFRPFFWIFSFAAVGFLKFGDFNAWPQNALACPVRVFLVPSYQSTQNRAKRVRRPCVALHGQAQKSPGEISPGQKRRPAHIGPAVSLLFSPIDAVIAALVQKRAVKIHRLVVALRCGSADVVADGFNKAVPGLDFASG